MNQEMTANDIPWFVAEYVRTNPYDRYVDLEDLDNKHFVLASQYMKKGNSAHFIEYDKSKVLKEFNTDEVLTRLDFTKLFKNDGSAYARLIWFVGNTIKTEAINFGNKSSN